MVFEAHGMSFSCTQLLLFNYTKVNTVFHYLAPLKKRRRRRIHLFVNQTAYKLSHCMFLIH